MAAECPNSGHVVRPDIAEVTCVACKQAVPVGRPANQFRGHRFGLIQPHTAAVVTS